MQHVAHVVIEHPDILLAPPLQRRVVGQDGILFIGEDGGEAVDPRRARAVLIRGDILG